MVSMRAGLRVEGKKGRKGRGEIGGTGRIEMWDGLKGEVEM